MQFAKMEKNMFSHCIYRQYFSKEKNNLKALIIRSQKCARCILEKLSYKVGCK